MAIVLNAGHRHAVGVTAGTPDKTEVCPVCPVCPVGPVCPVCPACSVCSASANGYNSNRPPSLMSHFGVGSEK